MLFSERGMWHDRLIFRDISQKTWKAGVLFNLTHASDQLIKGVSWRTVNQNCAWVVLKLSGMPLNKKKKTQQTADGYSEKTKHCNRICLL